MEGVRRKDGEDNAGREVRAKSPRQSREPVPRRPYQSERGVEERDHEVRDGQVNDEEAGGRMHSLVLEDNVTDQDVAKEREDDDEGVSHNEQGFHGGVLGLGPVAPPAHKVLPVGEGVVVPDEVRGVGHGQGHRQAWLILPALGALRGSHQGEEDEQHPVLDHFAGATAPGTLPSRRPRWTAGGRARVGRGARGCPGRDPRASERPAERLLAARASSPRSARLGLVPHFYVPAPRGCEPAPPPIGQRSVSGGDSDALPLSQLRGCSPTESALPLED